MKKFKLTKIEKDENGNNIYNYRGFIIHREYLFGEGYNWLAGDKDNRHFDVIHMKPNKPLVISNCISGGSTYETTLSELTQYIDEILADPNSYISESAWPFDFSKKSESQQNMVMEKIIDKNRFEV